MNSFTWINKQGVQSSEGFALQRVDRFHYDYVENGKTLRVAVDGDGIYQLYLPPDAVWEPPFEQEKLETRDLDRIAANMKEAMDFKGIPCRIHRE